MLTPQEVTGHVFDKAVFGGYEVASVDKFLDQLTEDYTALYKESGILKTKMKVLVDKVEEYRSTEDAMRMALLQAEKTARGIIEDAEKRRDAIDEEVAQKRAQLMEQAEAEVAARRAELQEALSSEEAALERAKKATAEYLGRLRASLAAYTETLDRVYDYVEPLPPEEEAPPAQPEPDPTAELAQALPPEEEKPVEKEGVSQDTVERIAEMISKSFSSDQPEKAVEGTKADPTVTRTLEIDFDNLQFGPYDPKKAKNGAAK